MRGCKGRPQKSQGANKGILCPTSPSPDFCVSLDFNSKEALLSD